MVNIDFARVSITGLNGRPLLIGAQKKAFTVFMHGNRFVFVPASTKKPRPSTDWEEAKTIFDAVARTGDRRPCTYKSMSGNASYILALLEYFESSLVH